MKSLQATILEEVEALSQQLRGYLGMQNWDIRLQVASQEDARASCVAQPEYLEAIISCDPDKLQTGDDLQEVVCHEHVHCILWKLQSLAENQSKALQAQLDESTRAAVGALMDEQVRATAEEATTQVGWTVIRMLRRIWQLESELKEVKAKLRGYSNA